VVVVDWVRRRGRVCVAELRDFGKLRWSALALIAFVAGFAASIPFSNTTAGYDFVASHPAFTASLQTLRGMGVRVLFDPDAPYERRLPLWREVVGALPIKAGAG